MLIKQKQVEGSDETGKSVQIILIISEELKTERHTFQSELTRVHTIYMYVHIYVYIYTNKCMGTTSNHRSDPIIALIKSLCNKSRTE